MPNPQNGQAEKYGFDLVKERSRYKKIRKHTIIPTYLQVNFFPAIYGAGEE